MLLLWTLLCLSLDVIYQTLSLGHMSQKMQLQKKNATSTVKINVDFKLWGMQLNALGHIFKFYFATSVHLVPIYDNIFAPLPFFAKYIEVKWYHEWLSIFYCAY